MTPSTDAQAGAGPPARKPRLAYALATVFGVGYLRPGPGTWGSLAGVVTAFSSAVFFLRPVSWRAMSSLHPFSDGSLAHQQFLVPAVRPLVCALALLLVLSAIGVWSASEVALHSGIKDPQHVVIDEVAGQHLALLLPLVPVALPHWSARGDFSEYAIFLALSLVNWKYLMAGFILFRVLDIWKPFPVRQLEKLSGGWGIMADDWMAGVYAAILLRLALHFNLV